MTPRRVLLCALLMGCGKFGANGAEPKQRTHECMLTPAGRTYRITTAGPILRGAGESTGALVAYLSEPLPVAQRQNDADVLVAAFGPEMLLAGEKTLTVEVRSPVPGTPLRSKEGIVFKPNQGRWERQQALPPSAAAGPVPGHPEQDENCAAVTTKLKAAGEVAWRWVRLLDAGVDAVVQQMSAEFRGQVEATPDRWLQVLTERENLGVGARRVELYRMQTRNRRRTLSAGDTVLIEYASQPEAARRVLERVVMVNDPSGWRIDGYVFQPLPGS